MMAVVVNNELKEKFDITLDESIIKQIDNSTIEVDKELNIVSFELFNDREYMDITTGILRDLTAVEKMMYEPIRLFNSIKDVENKINEYIVNDIYEKSHNMVPMSMWI